LIVFDASAVVSAALKENGVPEQALLRALAAGAHTIVSGDQDLLVLDPWRNVRILSPAAYLQASQTGPR